MKLKFKFGYINILRWLTKHHQEPYWGTGLIGWDKLIASYRQEWKLTAHREYDLTVGRAQDIINTLKKL